MTNTTSQFGDDIPGLNLLPEKLRIWVLILAAVSPYITRAFYAVANGGGFRGIARAIWFGTNTPVPPPETVTVAPKLPLAMTAAMLLALPSQAAWYDGIIGFAQEAKDAKQLTFAAYPGYAPSLKLDDGQKAPWGAGIALLYPVLTDYTLVGARLDWLADAFWAPSIDLTVKADVQFFGHNFTPFVMGGTIVPLGGDESAQKDFGGIVGSGIYTTIWKPTEQTSLQIFYCYEHWYAPLDTDVHRPGLALTIKF